MSVKELAKQKAGILLMPCHFWIEKRQDLSLVLILVSCLGLVGPVGLGLVGLGLNRRGDI